MKDFEDQANLDNNHCAVYGFMYVYTQVYIYEV